MPDIPSDIGRFTLKGDLIEAFADSSDPGVIPDSLPFSGSVLISADGIDASKPYVIDPANDKVISLRPVECRIVQGKIVPPDNGFDGSGDAGDPVGDPGVTLVANRDNPAIHLLNWRWKLEFRPPPGARWAKFTIYVDGAPGEVVSVAQAALVASTVALVIQPTVWSVAVPEGDDPLDHLPNNARAGQFLFDTTTYNLYRIGA